ncbi:MAG: hypothetical protein ICV83_07770, partial [Cytophagales bacterium]|nr:hypothetical protein [Cytophagales bacterium]
YGPWTITGSREVFRPECITLRNDDVRKPDDSPGTYTPARVKSGVAVLPVDEHGQVYLVRQFHYAVGRDSVDQDERDWRMNGILAGLRHGLARNRREGKGKMEACKTCSYGPFFSFLFFQVLSYLCRNPAKIPFILQSRSS